MSRFDEDRDRVFRLEADRRRLIVLFNSLADVESNAQGPAEAVALDPAFSVMFGLVQQALTALDEHQTHHIALMQDEEAGWKGGQSLDVYGARLLMDGEGRVRRRTPGMIPVALFNQFVARAREFGVSPAQLLESLIRMGLTDRRVIVLPDKTCPACGRTFGRAGSTSTYRAQTYCSRACGARERWKRERAGREKAR